MATVAVRKLDIPKAIVGICLLWVALTFVLSVLPLYAIDFVEYFLPAARLMVAGESPYNVEGFYNPPWALYAVIPFMWLPEHVAQAAFLSTAMVAMALAMYDLGVGTLESVAIMLSVPAISTIVHGNLEWVVLLGVVLPPGIGAFFVMAKPQIGIGVLAYWIIDEFKEFGIRGAVRAVLPITVVSLLFFVAYGFWPGHMLKAPIRSTASGANAALFPWLVPVGVLTLSWALRRKQVKDSLLVGPCFSPHLMASSWLGAFVALSDNRVYLLVAVILSWIAVVAKEAWL